MQTNRIVKWTQRNKFEPEEGQNFIICLTVIILRASHLRDTVNFVTLSKLCYIIIDDPGLSKVFYEGWEEGKCLGLVFLVQKLFYLSGFNLIVYQFDIQGD